MKKKNIIIASASLLSAMAIGAGIVGISPKAAEVKAEGKTEVLFNLTNFNTLNANIVVLDADTDLSAIASNYATKWVVNGQEKTTYTMDHGTAGQAGTSLILTWNGSSLPKDNMYSHYRLDAGTVIYENETTKYVLEKEYNFWRALHSGGGNFGDWVGQHGTWGNNVEIDRSFSLKDSSGGAIQVGEGLNRWALPIDYVKSSEWQSNGVFWGNGFLYATNDSADYSLAYTLDDEGHALYLYGNDETGVGLEKTTSLTGQEYFLISFSGFDTTTGDDKFLSFYFPKGTLFGGCNAGYPCFLEHDYYITILKDRIFGSTESTANLIYTPVKSFIDDNMKMGDSAYEGEGTDLCKTDGTYAAAKTAYNALTENQKFAFCNFPGYTDAFNRLTAWATANGETLNSTTGEISKSSSFTILGDGDKDNNTLYYAVLAISALLVITVTSAFYFRKKRHN